MVNIDALLSEWAYRCKKGYPDLDSPSDLRVLKSILGEQEISLPEFQKQVIVEDDGDGYPSDILSKIGEPYLKTIKEKFKSKSGLGLGIFIGKTLLEKNFAILNFRNSKTRSGAEVIIKWRNKDLFNI